MNTVLGSMPRAIQPHDHRATFSIDPRYKNNPNDANLQYETFVASNSALGSGESFDDWHRADWWIRFSKSGIGAQDLILKHPEPSSWLRP